MCALAWLGGCRRQEVHRRRCCVRRGGDARVVAVRLLLELGAGVEVPDRNGRRRSCYGRGDASGVLLELGGDAEAPDPILCAACLDGCA